MKNFTFLTICLVAASLFITGCASISGFEEGRSLGKGTSELMFSLNYINLSGFYYVNETINSEFWSGFPNIDGSFKYGVTDKLDVGGRLTSNLNLGAFVKYQLIDDDISQFAMGTGLEFATSLGILYDIKLPLNMSYYVTDAITINVSPKYIYQFPSLDNYLGVNTGILYGKNSKFGIDVGYYRLEGAGLLTVGIGGKFRFNDK